VMMMDVLVDDPRYFPVNGRGSITLMDDRLMIHRIGVNVVSDRMLSPFRWSRTDMLGGALYFGVVKYPLDFSDFVDRMDPNDRLFVRYVLDRSPLMDSLNVGACLPGE